MEEFHIPSCPSLPSSNRVAAPPFPHVTLAVTEKPSTNISSTWIWLQYNASQYHPRVWRGQPLGAWHPAEIYQIPELEATFKILIVQPPLLGDRNELLHP